MEYQIVEEDGVYDLAETVRAEIKSGWQPQGGVFCINIGDATYYGQAMIKYPKMEVYNAIAN